MLVFGLCLRYVFEFLSELHSSYEIKDVICWSCSRTESCIENMAKRTTFLCFGDVQNFLTLSITSSHNYVYVIKITEKVVRMEFWTFHFRPYERVQFFFEFKNIKVNIILMWIIWQCLIQITCTIIALLTMSKNTTVVIPAVRKRHLSCPNISGGCNLNYVLSSDVGKVAESFTTAAFFVHMMLLSSKRKSVLRYMLGFAVSCSAAGWRASAVV